MSTTGSPTPRLTYALTDQALEGRSVLTGSRLNPVSRRLASGILEYEDIPDEDGDGIMDRGSWSGEGENTAAARLGF